MRRTARGSRINQDLKSNIQSMSLPNNNTSQEFHSHVSTNLHGEFSSSSMGNITECPHDGNGNIVSISIADIDKKLFWVESQILQILQRRRLRAQQAENNIMNSISHSGSVPTFVPFQQINMNIHQALAHLQQDDSSATHQEIKKENSCFNSIYM